MCLEGRAIIRTKLGIAETTRPCSDSVRGRSKESKASLSVLGDIGPRDRNDEKESLFRDLNTEMRAVSNDRWANVKV